MIAPLVRQLMLRGLWIWLLLRCTHAVVLLLARIHPTPSAGLAIVPVVMLAALLSIVDIARRRETVFFGNLGVPQSTVAAVGAAPAAAMELLLGLPILAR